MLPYILRRLLALTRGRYLRCAVGSWGAPNGGSDDE
jgi:hypothetical protein